MESKKEVMHTPEPWRLEKAEPERQGNYYVLAPDMNLAIARVYENAGEANARRIVACVNACKHYSTEDLEEVGEHLSGVFAYTRGRCAELIAQRDELLEALKALEKRAGHMANQCGYFQDEVSEIVAARAVIAKC